MAFLWIFKHFTVWRGQGHHQNRLAVRNAHKQAPGPVVKTNHMNQEWRITWRDCGMLIACRCAWVTDLPYANTNACTVHSISWQILEVLVFWRVLCLKDTKLSLLVHLRKEDETRLACTFAWCCCLQTGAQWNNIHHKRVGIFKIFIFIFIFKNSSEVA